MSMLNKFINGLGKQQERKTDEIKVEKDVVLEQLVGVYCDWLREQKTLSWKSDYSLGLNKINGLEYSCKDITKLCLKLKDYEQKERFERSGLFLSALINNCKDLEFLLLTDHLKKEIICIGYKNFKNIIIQGNTGRGTGWHMQEGIIKVQGNTGYDTG